MSHYTLTLIRYYFLDYNGTEDSRLHLVFRVVPIVNYMNFTDYVSIKYKNANTHDWVQTQTQITHNDKIFENDFKPTLTNKEVTLITLLEDKYAIANIVKSNADTGNVVLTE